MNPTIDASPSPQLVTIIMALMRALLMIGGTAGLLTSTYTDTQLAPIASAVATLIGVGWQIYEQFRQAKMRNAAAVVSARSALPVQHFDYSRS